jgi:hypothetical protein
MVGPFSFEQATSFVGGQFCTSPLGLVPRPNSDKMRIVHDLSFKYDDGSSANSYIDKEDYPCKWTTAEMFAQWVSFHGFSWLLVSLSPLLFFRLRLHLHFYFLHGLQPLQRGIPSARIALEGVA